VNLSLKDDQQTRDQWNYKFELVYEIILTSKNELITQLSVTNCEEERTFDFTALLHTYYKVNDISTVEVYGLNNCDYTDKVKSADGKHESEILKIVDETDSIFKRTTSKLKLVHYLDAPTKKREILIEKTNLPDTGKSNLNLI
jgi:glucose-6-phosphate 1-epimerase